MKKQLRRWLAAAPTLTALSGGVDCNDPECHCSEMSWQVLRCAGRSLTELDLLLTQPRDPLDLLRRISADALPQLRRLSMDAELFDVDGAEDDDEAAALLQRMPLTTLRINASSDLWGLLHHLPQLAELCCTMLNEGAILSIPTAPQLQKLQLIHFVSLDALVALLRRWWHQLGRPELRTDGHVPEAEWQKHLQQQKRSLLEYAGVASNSDGDAETPQPPPALRELILELPADEWGDDGSLPAFSYLALLPNLRVLECPLRSAHYSALALLPQLEELRLHLTLVNDEEHGYKWERWDDAGLQRLGAAPLPSLTTLRLCGGDEEDWMQSAGNESQSNQRQEGAAPGGITLIGLCALLQLPALTALSLPWVDEAVLAEFRAVKQQKDRASLLVECFIPLTRRPRMERQWLDRSELRLEPLIRDRS